MADIDLTNMSLEELKTLKNQVARAIDSYEERRKKEALSVIEAKARELGFSIGELYAAPKKGASAPRPAKYQNPENAEQTWSGRGRQPQWFKDAVEAGATPDDLLI
ncbi:H-NS histone family protein [Meridianimarinicoccus aquatilis]|uniref:H-NS histone family protein n=1 Tax=Meridianimarinicoccus aquatilis TaxID=2552766 RepID=A0A4R6ARH4_9RHOB|nr:H-NS histone family protein [Fluviibacterium aquatile]QIE40981.1 H-NS histone family protein [Rhodobacteraceae bacterium SC52]TDL84686.1 H-NS histone family protein [Fluviibacterium aquatile]